MSDDSVATETSAGLSRHGNVRYGIFVIMFLIFFVAYLDRANVSVLIADSHFTQALGIAGDKSVQGLLMTAFLLFYGIASFFIGPVIDRLGPRKVLVYNLVLWAILVSPLESAVGPWLLYLPAGRTLSFLLAIGVRRSFPAAGPSGRWIWALPVSLLTLMFVLELRTWSLGYALAEFFYPGPDGEAWWVFFIATCPTGSAVAYSLGMIWSARRQAKKASLTQNSGPGDASGVTLSSSP